MRFGPEQDPIEQLDRDEERAIAAAVKARFGHGDLTSALRQVDDLARQRLALNARGSRLYA
ncbi:hypothetical protein [Sphingomonas sp. CFBP 13720]|uniref:hypothetical protein n=1 Tax=Sphingomonas sp. CFBP 13720 TaxID=2775302 RepID=UPI00177D3FC5|nr:hypothetical protein [Sphingomonas sp. CFBP 13720]MBD8679250.1 hypothetical protein [Sphingomonas sp. CFBP 13720]